MKKGEVKRLSGKLSFQGDALKRRISNQMSLVDRDRIRERQAKQSWFEAQLRLLKAENELEILCKISLRNMKNEKK